MNTALATKASLSNAPGPSVVNIISRVSNFKKSDPPILLQTLRNDYGDVVRASALGREFYLLSHPDAVKRVLASDKGNFEKGRAFAAIKDFTGSGLFALEGAEWRTHRTLMQPFFTKAAVQTYANDVLAAAESCAVKLRAAAEKNQTIDLNAEMMDLTLDVISRTMFSQPINELPENIKFAFDDLLKSVAFRSALPFKIPKWLPLPDTRRLNAAKAVLFTFFDKIIDQRKAQLADKQSANQFNDFLSEIIQASEEQGGSLSQQDIRDEILTVFFAGHETTAQAFSWCWYLLSQHRQYDTRVYQEATQAFANHDVPDLDELTASKQVFMEAMRLYPPAFGIPRDVVVESEFDGYRIPVGATVIVSPYVTHRHEDFWERPNEFYPEHFTDAAIKERHNYAYFPFGAGPRSCIGNHFAMLEAQYVIAYLSQHFEFHLAQNTPVETLSIATIKPEHGLPMRVKLRERE